VLQLADRDFSVISLRQGTVCGWSPRMRFDLIVNTMFKAAVSGGTITVNNPSIWRPVLDIRDTVAAFTRAIQANARISGVFNVASGNYTVGQTADLVKERTERLTGQRVKLDIRSLEDLRNYKVSLDRARIELGFEPQYSIKDIVDELHEHFTSYGDLEQEQYYNIRVFNRLAARTMQPA
jgi:nucleoside-diphosphate-sugar epimerase